MATQDEIEAEVSRIETDPGEFRQVVACMLMQERVDVVGLLHRAYVYPTQFGVLRSVLRQHVYEHARRNVNFRETYLRNWSPEQRPT